MTVTIEQTGVFKSLAAIARVLHVVVVVDKSGSMTGAPIGQANYGGKEFAAGVAVLQKKYPNVKIRIRVVAFSSDVEWVTDWVDAEKFRWVDISTDGGTEFGKLINALRQEMITKNLGTAGLQPHVIVLTDGKPNDEYKTPLKQFVASQPWGAASIRSAIACGAHCDTNVLKEWIGESGGILAEVDSSGDLAQTLTLLALSAVEHGSASPSKLDGTPMQLQEVFDEKVADNEAKEAEGNDIASHI